jgi:hypothetical protein
MARPPAFNPHSLAAASDGADDFSTVVDGWTSSSGVQSEPYVKKALISGD